MALTEVRVPTHGAPLSRDLRRYLKEADRRVEEFLQRGRVTGFVPSDYAGAGVLLPALVEAPVIRGTRFCEWGSGFGVVAGLAAGLGFEAFGIEAEGELVEEARTLAADFDLAVEFVHGSFVPRGGENRVHAFGTYSWLETEGDYAYDELDLDPDDFDVIFAYPWPDEEEVTADLFDRYAGPGAILITYSGGGDFRLRRKVEPKTKGRRPGWR